MKRRSLFMESSANRLDRNGTRATLYQPATRAGIGWHRVHAAITLVVPLAMLASCNSSCNAQANPPNQSPRPHAAEPDEPPAPGSFDPEVVRVAPDSVVGRVRAAVDESRHDDARQIAETAIASASVSAGELGELQWLAAESAVALGDATGALRHLEALAESAHPLAPWARLKWGEAISSTQPERVRDLGLSEVSFPGSRRATLVEVGAYERLGDRAGAIGRLRSIASLDASSPGSDELRLARLLAAGDSADERVEAYGLLRAVALQDPESSDGRAARQEATTLAAQIPAARRRDLEPLTSASASELAFARAEALYNAMRHDDAADAFGALAGRLTARSGETPSELYCRARLMQGKALLRSRDRADGAQVLEAMIAACAHETDLRAAARYNCGRALSRLGQYDRAIAHFEAIVTEAPASSLVDDAMLRAARSAAAKGDVDGMVSRLSSIPTRFPDGDMRGEARFRLAWHYIEEGQHAQALAVLAQSIEEGPGEQAEDIRGRAAYWRASMLAELGRREEAIAKFEEIARDLPLSYYAQQSLSRLASLDAAVRDRVLTAMRSATDESLRFPIRAEFQQAGFLRALALLRVGETDLAQRELYEMGALGEGADSDLLWTSAALLDRAGALPEASRLVRRRLGSFHRVMPVGRGRQLWRLAYPAAFSPLLDNTATGEGVPPSLVRAIAREESAFDPRAVSVAHAYGLIQLIRPTARQFGQQVGLPSDRASLMQPAINLRIGSRYIRFLRDRFSANPALVPAAYNAGHGAVERWLRERGSLPLDRFIESIPYDETRRYSRRVLQTYGVYSWLDTGALPDLPVGLPTP